MDQTAFSGSKEYIFDFFLSDYLKMDSFFQMDSFSQMDSFIRQAADVASAVIVNAVKKECVFMNDTKYNVKIIDWDGTHDLRPGTSQGNYLLNGFSLDLVMHLPGGKEAKINFHSSQFENRTHKMSSIFEAYIRDCEISVTGASSRWDLSYNHHGGFEVRYESRLETKNSWRKMQESGLEADAKVGGMIKAIELSASFKAYTKMSSVEEQETHKTSSSEYTVKDTCYIWQEMVDVKTNQPKPYDELTIPTVHTEVTSTPDKPPRSKLIYCK